MGTIAGTVLVSSASREVDATAGRWDKVLRLPIAFGNVAEAVDELLRRSQKEPKEKEPKDEAAVAETRARIAEDAGFELRLGAPWPMIRCARCGASRHVGLPKTRAMLGALRQSLASFWLEHTARHAD
jgi:hypothetical protein